MPLRGPGTTGGGITGLTANTVPYANSSTSLADSSVTKTELEYVHNVTSAIQTQLNSKVASASLTKTVTESTISSDYTLTTSYADTGLSCTFTTTAADGGIVELKLIATGSSATLVLDIWTAYSIDAGADVPIALVSTIAGGSSVSLCSSLVISGLSNASHTIKIRAKKDTAGTASIYGTANGVGVDARLQIIQTKVTTT